MSGALEVRGGDQLVATLDAADKALDDLEVADQQAGTLVAHKVTQTGPRLTGALLDTVTVHVAGGLVEVTAGGGAVDYAPPVEARTGFMANAARTTEDAVVRVYQSAVDDVAGTIRGA